MGDPIREGDVIDGAYVVERLLGKGGMGAVFVAHEKRLARRVAIKVLLSGAHAGSTALARFEREARSAAALQSDHVARVFSVGRIGDTTPYIVMELLDGDDLAALLAQRGPLTSADVITYMLQVCDALTEAHALGIVHRDLKPANIFLARRPTGATTIKVLDFGISKGAAGGTVSPLTATEAVMGTPLYMSPEQVQDVRAVDGRADIWALGAVMYELLTGKPPFLAASMPDLLQRILHSPVERLSTRRPDVMPALEAVVLRCLEKKASDRFASVRELSFVLAHCSTASAPSPASAGPPKPSPSTRQMHTERIAPAASAPAAASSVPAVSPHAASVEAPQRPVASPFAGSRAASPQTVEPVIAQTLAPVIPTNRPSTAVLAVVVGVTVAVVAIAGGASMFASPRDDKAVAQPPSSASVPVAGRPSDPPPSASASASATSATSATDGTRPASPPIVPPHGASASPPHAAVSPRDVPAPLAPPPLARSAPSTIPTTAATPATPPVTTTVPSRPQTSSGFLMPDDRRN